MLISNFAMHIRAVSESATEVEAHGDMTWWVRLWEQAWVLRGAILCSVPPTLWIHSALNPQFAISSLPFTLMSNSFRYKASAVVVTVRIATSLISPEQAIVNLERYDMVPRLLHRTAPCDDNNIGWLIQPSLSFDAIPALIASTWRFSLLNFREVDISKGFDALAQEARGAWNKYVMYS